MHSGQFRIKQRRDGVVISERLWKNEATNLGAQTLLDGIFNGGVLPANWYIGLVEDGASFSTSNTMASHPGWTEFTDYSGSRKLFDTDAASGRTVDNITTPAVFTFTTLAVIDGVFLTSDVTKGGATGILLATAYMGSTGNAGSLALVVGDDIEIVYEVFY